MTDIKNQVKDETELIEVLSGEQYVHRLRNWEDGDVLYGVSSFNVGSDISYRTLSGKTFKDKQRAISHFEGTPERLVNPNLFDVVLYTATIGSPSTESTAGRTHTYEDEETGEKKQIIDSEPPEKSANLTNVEILGRMVFDKADRQNEFDISRY